jgi:hypothetical protein
MATAIDRFAKSNLLIFSTFLSGPKFASAGRDELDGAAPAPAALFSTQLSTGFAVDIKLK